MYGLGNESSVPGSFMELGVGDTEVISIAWTAAAKDIPKENVGASG